jgi:5-formyltetrahydrofolate cyclo-ligase
LCDGGARQRHGAESEREGERCEPQAALSRASARVARRLIYWVDSICSRHSRPDKFVKVAASPAAQPTRRQALRTRLLGERDAFVATSAFDAANDALLAALRAVLARLEPECLGLYWPVRSEFNAAAALAADPDFDKVARALPYARRAPRSMEFRRWSGSAPTLFDECGIGCADGEAVLPDVVVVPCVGFTAAGHRLGYGGGYYDRWLAANGQVVAVGVAWSFAEIDLATFAPEPHDVPLAFIVTEAGVR